MNEEQERALEIATLMRAWANGKTLQYQSNSGDGEWIDYRQERVPTVIFVAWWRVKPEPPKLREWWLAIDRHGIYARASREAAEYLAAQDGSEVVHVREVLDAEEAA